MARRRRIVGLSDSLTRLTVALTCMCLCIACLLASKIRLGIALLRRVSRSHVFVGSSLSVRFTVEPIAGERATFPLRFLMLQVRCCSLIDQAGRTGTRCQARAANSLAAAARSIRCESGGSGDCTGSNCTGNVTHVGLHIVLTVLC